MGKSSVRLKHMKKVKDDLALGRLDPIDAVNTEDCMAHRANLGEESARISMLKTKGGGKTLPVAAGEPVGFKHKHRSGCPHLIDQSAKDNRLPGSRKTANVDETMGC